MCTEGFVGSSVLQVLYCSRFFGLERIVGIFIHIAIWKSWVDLFSYINGWLNRTFIAIFQCGFSVARSQNINLFRFSFLDIFLPSLGRQISKWSGTSRLIHFDLSSHQCCAGGYQ